jgi:hypothetical protein
MGCYSMPTVFSFSVNFLQAHQEYERRLKEELEVKAAKEQEIADLVRGRGILCCLCLYCGHSFPASCSGTTSSVKQHASGRQGPSSSHVVGCLVALGPLWQQVQHMHCGRCQYRV